jgi:multidrug resistance efflux pump
VRKVSLFSLSYFWLVCVACAEEPKPDDIAIEGRGVVVPLRRVTITSAAPGQVAEVLVQLGQRVKRGEALFRLERTGQELDVKKAEIALRTAKVRLEQSRGGTRQEALKIIRAEVASAEANLTQARVIFDRVRKLLDTNLAPRRDLDQAEAGVRVAEAQLEKQRAVLVAAEKEKGEEAESVRLAVESAAIDYSRKKFALDARTVYAPFDGTILHVGVETGSFTNPAMIGLAQTSSLCELADISVPLVEVTLPESAFGQVAIGTKCEASLSVLRKKLPGTVERISPAIDPVRNSFTVRVKLATTETLPIGASALVRFTPKQ